MIDLSDIKIEQVENDGKVGIFKIGPLPKGYGNTIANPLRRVLLSSLPGAGVVSMRLEGVEHEYSTLKGVKETVVEIQMNIKGIRFSCQSDEPQVLTLKKKGIGDITAGDFSLTGDVTVMNPKVKIATLTDKSATFDLEVVVERGVGYQVADEDLRSEVGRLPMHADFSPVERVMFSIDQARKGKQLDLDQIVLTIYADGSIDPRDAIGRATEILRTTFERMMTLTGIAPEPVVEKEVPAEEVPARAADAEAWLIEDLPISARSKSRLLEAGITKLGDVVSKSASDLLDVPGFGEAALREMKELLKEYGLSLQE